ncbi:MAG: hypothetical protein ACJAZH_000512 [Roseivirga sp.]|jgi:hypothetical protein
MIFARKLTKPLGEEGLKLKTLFFWDSRCEERGFYQRKYLLEKTCLIPRALLIASGHERN